MSYRLLITVSFNKNVSHYLTKIIEVDPATAKEKHIHEGTHEAGVLYECENGLKVSYRGAFVWLPKDQIKIIDSVEVPA